MASWIWGVLGGLGLGGTVLLVLYFLRAAARDSADLSLANSALQTARDQAATMNAAAVAERARRARELDEKATAVRTAGDAAGLLRDVTGAGSTKT